MKTLIKTYRLSQGMTQIDLAKLLGVTQATVSRLEDGAKPRPKLLKKLCELIGVPVCQKTESSYQHA